jgi:hypothetical protein
MIGLIADLNNFFCSHTPKRNIFFLEKKKKNLRKLQPFPLGCVHIPTEKNKKIPVLVGLFFFASSFIGPFFFIDVFREENLLSTAFDVV